MIPGHPQQRQVHDIEIEDKDQCRYDVDSLASANDDTENRSYEER